MKLIKPILIQFLEKVLITSKENEHGIQASYRRTKYKWLESKYGCVTQVVEHLPTKSEELISNPSTIKKKEQKSKYRKMSNLIKNK
jgi:hypothetical protein